MALFNAWEGGGGGGNKQQKAVKKKKDKLEKKFTLQSTLRSNGAPEPQHYHTLDTS